jgi:DNA helicase-2/ATP-dependent DNA helicase PcrA
MALPDVVTLPLPNSGRCAPLIFGAANRLVEWVCDQHPVAEVRRNAFRRQQILPTPPGDAQPNPPDDEAALLIKVFRHREEDEAPAIAQLAAQYAQNNPEHTVAILTPTNDFGHAIADRLDGLDVSYDNLLRGGTRVREIASLLSWLLRLLANPLDRRALEEFHDWLLEFQHPVIHQDGDLDSERLAVLLRSISRPELLLFAEDNGTRLSALPSGVATDEECSALIRYARFVQRLFQYRPLAIDDMILSLSDELFTNEDGPQPAGGQADLAISYQLAAAVRQWWELQPEYRLPELADQLAEVAEGRRRLHNVGYDLSGYDPQPGRITLATQHGAKGMEWDAVFLAGIDGQWIPRDLESHFIGVEALINADPAAEVSARLHYLMGSDGGLYPGRSPTESAHIEIICERLRLLYVGITRARRYLHISRSRRTTRRQRDTVTEPATIMGVLYRYLQSNTSKTLTDTSP